MQSHNHRANANFFEKINCSQHCTLLESLLLENAEAAYFIFCTDKDYTEL